MIEVRRTKGDIFKTKEINAFSRENETVKSDKMKLWRKKCD